MTSQTREERLISELKAECDKLLGGHDWIEVRIHNLVIERRMAWLIVAVMTDGPIANWPVIYAEKPEHLRESSDPRPNYDRIESYALPVMRRAL